MFIDACIRLFTALARLKAIRTEKQIGYTLLLHNLKPHWIPSIMTYDMTPVWQKDNLDVCGVNYFTIGAIQNGMSERFNADSPYYQAWFGGYLVKFANTKPWTIAKHYDLTVSDQKNWLRVYGDKKPYVAVDTPKSKVIGDITINGYNGKLYEGAIWSDTDVGMGNTYVPFLRKRWDESSPLKSYQKIYLYGYIAIIEISPSIKAVLYANGAIYTDTKGKKHDTFREIKSELWNLIESVEIKKL